MASLDTELDLLLVEKDYFEKNPSAGKVSIGPDDPLYIAVKFTGDVAALQRAGFQIASTVGHIAYGVTNLTGLEALARHPQVESIEKQRRRSTHLSDSVPDIHANQVWHRSGDNFNGYTGRGVIVGIIDTGIDFTHQVFRKPDGKTRILKIWDQTLTAQAGETVPGPITDPKIALGATPIPLGYGVEYNEQQINDTLAGGSPPVKVRHQDEDGHGTHVAGIAAGDGSQSGGCHLSYHYIGVATEADLIMVRKWGLSKSDKTQPPGASNTQIEAIQYILNEARKLQPDTTKPPRPVSINLSLGLFSDLMDGSAADCQSVDQLLTNNSIGTAIVYSAGNDGASRFHARGTVPAGPTAVLKLNFKIADNDKKSRSLSIRYTGSNLQVRLTSPVVATAGPVGWVTPGNSTVSNTANGLGGSVTVNNQPNRISIRLVPGPVLPPTAPATFVPNIDGTWTIELQDTGSSPTDFNAFCLYGSSHDPKSPFFLDHDTSDSTLDEDACGKECISVGCYKVAGRLSSFSSRGPTIETAPNMPRTKPEICAPGQDIVSAGLGKDRHGCKQCCCKCCRDYYVSKSGTSMSAPHIAGVIALMLHKDPTLTHTQIKAALTANAAPKPSDSTSAEDLGWGSGKVDVKKTVDAETQINPPVPKLAVPQPDALDALHEQLLATERGAELAGLYDKHAGEVWGLINRNKRVATVWHRCRGPVWVRLALRSAYAPNMRVPLEANGLSLYEGIQRFGAILNRYASAAFRQDLERYASDFALVRDGMSLQEMIEAVGNRHRGRPNE